MKITKKVCLALVSAMMMQAQPVYAVQAQSVYAAQANATDPAEYVLDRDTGMFQGDALNQDRNDTNLNTPDEDGNDTNLNTPDEDGNDTNRDTSGENGDDTNQDTPGENGDDTNQDTPGQDGDDTDTDKPDDDDSRPAKPSNEKKVPVPAAVTGLRTTAQSQSKVKVAWNARKHASRYIVYRKQGSSKYKKIATTKKTSYTDKTIKSGKTYHYKIVPQNGQKKKGKAARIAFSNKTIVKVSSKKYTYAQMKQQMKALKNKYSDYCEVTEIGTSASGRKLYDFVIGNPDADSSILVVSTLHAREYICSALLMQEIEYYLSNYNHTIGGIKPANVLKRTQIHYVVMANPDGVTISQKSHERWKSNARGVDLNRNFPTTKFVVGGKKGSQGYSGKKALSEPESRAVAALTLQLKKDQNLQGVVNYHAMGRIIYGSCLSKKLSKDTKTMYNIAKSETGYTAAYEAHSGNTAPGGQYREYVMYMLGIPSITIEVGKTIAPCSYYEYQTEFKKNKNVVLKIAKTIG